MPMPTAVAIQWVDVTTPKVPSISGRVVKRFGLTKFMELPGLGPKTAGLDHSLPMRPTALAAGQRPCLHMRLISRPPSGRFGAVNAIAHPLEDFGPIFGVQDRLPHQQQEGLFLEVAAPALAAVEVDVMA